MRFQKEAADKFYVTGPVCNPQMVLKSCFNRDDHQRCRRRCARQFTNEGTAGPKQQGRMSQTELLPMWLRLDVQMTQPKDEFRFGFLTAVKADDDAGIVGGLLITTKTGRPLEFQCTTPVKPNRTQTILFGDTLQPYLIGELISKTLIERVDVKPTIILTDTNEILEVRSHVEIPVLQLLEDEEVGDFEVGRWSLNHHADFAGDISIAEKYLREVPQQANLHEPLQRTQDALQETIRPGAAA